MASASQIRARFYAALEQGMSHDEAVALANGTAAAAPVTPEPNPAPAQQPAPDLTPEAIASMEKPALVDLLESSGVDFDKRLGAEKLRELAQQVAHSEPSADG
ncbi:hypothetical protein [Paracoccus siganidrum]|uniref:hypothetical protein n=1 Tax=Paracoccus siganidrum TaxID=1276757 RepID=UPI000F0349F0|nr:hypothetical protein [Paracoccus siganidrum]RMC39330.1 hypothetical protein C9E82_04960 [Paracoccus siganidrum]